MPKRTNGHPEIICYYCLSQNFFFIINWASSAYCDCVWVRARARLCVCQHLIVYVIAYVYVSTFIYFSNEVTNMLCFPSSSVSGASGRLIQSFYWWRSDDKIIGDHRSIQNFVYWDRFTSNSRRLIVTIAVVVVSIPVVIWLLLLLLSPVVVSRAHRCCCISRWQYTHLDQIYTKKKWNQINILYILFYIHKHTRTRKHTPNTEQKEWTEQNKKKKKITEKHS